MDNRWQKLTACSLLGIFLLLGVQTVALHEHTCNMNHQEQKQMMNQENKQENRKDQPFNKEQQQKMKEHKQQLQKKDVPSKTNEQKKLKNTDKQNV